MAKASLLSRSRAIVLAGVGVSLVFGPDLPVGATVPLSGCQTATGRSADPPAATSAGTAGRNNGFATQSPGLVGAAWSTDLHGRTLPGFPVAVGGCLIVGDSAGFAYAIDAASGAKVWERQLFSGAAPSVGGVPGGAFAVDAASSGWNVLVSGTDGSAVVVDARTGKSIRKYRSRPGTPTLFGDRAFLEDSLGDGLIYSMSLGSGQVVWKYQIDQNNLATEVAYGAGLVFFGVGGKLIAVEARSGMRAWEAQLVDPLYVPQDRSGTVHAAQPAFASNRVFGASEDGKLHAVSSKTGAQLWAIPVGTPPLVEGVAASANYVAFLDDTTLIVVDAATGAERWRHSLPSFSSVSPTIAGGEVMVTWTTPNPSYGPAGYDSTVAAFDLATGSPRGQVAGIPGAVVDNIAVVEGRPVVVVQSKPKVNFGAVVGLR